MSLETLQSRQETRLNSSGTERFQRAVWNVAVGSAIVAGGLFVLFNAPGVIPGGEV